MMMVWVREVTGHGEGLLRSEARTDSGGEGTGHGDGLEVG